MEAFTLKDLLLVIGPLVGVIVGGTITTVGKIAELRHSHRIQRERFRLERIEELYVLTNRMSSRAARINYFVSHKPEVFVDESFISIFEDLIHDLSEMSARGEVLNNLCLGPSETSWNQFRDSVADFIQVCSDFRHGKRTREDIDEAYEITISELANYRPGLLSSGKNLV